MTALPGQEANIDPGVMLRSARLAAGLGVADVAAQLRLSPRQIEALETGRHGDLPGAVFVRGFIRNYARLLKIDPVPLLHALEPALDAELPLRVRETSVALPLVARRTRARPLLVAFCAIVIVVVAAGGYEMWSRQGEQAAQATADTGSPGPAQAVIVAAESARPHASTVGTPTDVPVEIVAQDAGATQSPHAAPGAAMRPRPTHPRASRLRVKFSGDSWLEVRDREGVLYTGTGHAGSERVFEAAGPLSVVVGNANGVRITYNDEPLDLSAHAARNIARLTLE